MDMIESPAALPDGQPISHVERETGLAKETLRVWERRYGFPEPTRDAHGQRIYSIEDIAKLRLIKRLLDLGHRPGKIIQLSSLALQEMAQARAALRNTPSDNRREDELQACVELCGSHRIDELRFKLTELMLQAGLQGFVVDFLAPLNYLIGEAWAAGRIAVFEEHLYTESVQVVMRQAIATIPERREERAAAPRILLTTFPQERHGLGLLMVEALAALEGANCLSMGVQTPLDDIAKAVEKQRSDIVALSFSQAMRPRQVLDGLAQLRAMLPDNVEIWAGGAATVLKKQPLDAIVVLNLGDIANALAAWKSRQAKVA